jgi:hypothetical protein
LGSLGRRLRGIARACDRPSVKAPETRPVRTVTVDPKPIEDDRQAIGEVRAVMKAIWAFVSPAR